MRVALLYFLSTFFLLNNVYSQTKDTLGLRKTIGECAKHKSDREHEMMLQKANKYLPFVKETNWKEEGEIYHILALANLFRSSMEESEAYFKKAIRVFEINRSNSLDLLYGSKTSLGVLYKNTSQYDKSLVLFDEVYNACKEDTTISRRIYSNVLNSSANIYRRQRKMKLAISRYELAAKVFEEIGFKRGVGVAYTNLNLIWNEYGNWEKEQYYGEKALEIYDETLPSNHPWYSSLYNNFGRSYRIQKNYTKAKFYLEKGLEIIEERVPEGDDITIYLLANLIDTHVLLGEYEKAKILLKKNQKIVNRIRPNSIEAATVTLETYGDIAYMENDFEKAEQMYLSSLEAMVKHLPAKSFELPARYQMVSNFYYRIGKYQKAEIYQKKGLAALPTQNIDSYLSLVNNLLLAKILSKNGKIEEAKVLLRKYKKEIPIFDPNNLFQFSRPDLNLLKYYAESWMNISEHTKLIEDLKIAGTNFKNFLEVDRALKLGMEEPETQGQIVANQTVVFSNALNCFYQLFERTKDKKYFDYAYLLVEDSKQNQLKREIQKYSSNKNSGIPNSVLIKEAELKNSIIDFEKRLEEKKNSSISDSLFDARNALYSFNDSLKKTNPSYFSLQNKLAITSPQTIENQLNTNQTFLEYYISTEFLFILKIEKGNLDFFRTKINNEFESQVKDFVESIKKSDDFEIENLISKSNAVYKKLIEPAFPIKEKVVIVPHGILGIVPFDVLIKSEPEKKSDYKNLPFLIKEHTFSYQYSGSIWNELSKRKIEPKGLLAIAPSFQETNLTASVLRSDFLPLKNLIFNSKEVNEIGNLFSNNSILEGKIAKRDSFKSVASNFDIIHFATHAIINLEESEKSFIAFSNTEEDEADLSLSQVYDLDLSANMVVTSVCNGGVGKLRKGEGIISLGRGFLMAGAKNIITSLWSVNDKSTSEIMVDFYKNLKSGLPKDEALRQSKLAYLNRQNGNEGAPFYWAAFVSYGDQNPISMRNQIPFLWWIISSVILVGFGFYIKDWLKK